MSALIVVAFLIGLMVGLTVGHVLTDTFGFWRRRSNAWKKLSDDWRELAMFWRDQTGRWQSLAQDSVKLSGELVGDLQRTKQKKRELN